MRARPLVLGGGLLLFLLYAYPGFTSPDSIAQLTEARTGYYTDWHPPTMAFLWRYCDLIWSGPLLMLLLQSVTFLLGIDGILRTQLPPLRAASAAVIVLLFPPVMTTMAVVWKDAQMAGYLFAGAAALLSPRRRWRFAGLGLIFVATAIRHNALAATLPIVLLLFVWRDEWTRWRRYVVALAVWVTITAAAFATNRLLADHRTYPWHNSVALFDIAGTARYSKVTEDAALRELLSGVPLATQDGIAMRLHTAYFPTAHYQLTHGDDRVFDLPSVEQIDDVKAVWLRLVTSQPRAFLYHRLLVSLALLGASDAPPVGSVFHGATRPASTPIQRVWIDVIDLTAHSVIFRVYIYLVLALAFLAMCRTRISFALLASGIGCELSLFAAAPSTDFRYSHWLIACTVVTGIAIFVARYRTNSLSV